MSAWFHFLLRYLWVAIAGSLLVVAFVPRPDPADRRRPDPASQAPAAREQATADQLAEDSRHFADLMNELTPAAAPAAAPEEASAAHHTARRPPADTSHSRWGVVTRPGTPYYDLDGRFQGHLAPGALLDILDLKHNNGEQLALARRAADANTDAPRLLVRAAAVDIHRGALDTLSYELKRLHAERARLKIEIDTRIAQDETRLRADNPFTDAYNKARNDLRVFRQEVKRLRAGLESSEGADRVHYANELRAMKGRQAALNRNLEDAKSRYTAWNRTHPDRVPVETGLASLKKELENVERDIASRTSAR